MARSLRIEFEGAWYHVMNRGAGRCAIFKNDDHRRYFLNLLDVVSERFQAECHAYCLMTNHYHLMLRTPKGNLQRIMRHINGVYTQYYNREVRRDGPLFRGRYKAVLVDAQEYWAHLSRYIHRNPLDAGMVDNLEDYPWSSFPAFMDKKLKREWLHTDYILSGFGRQKRASYKKFVLNMEQDPVYEFYSKRKVRPILGADKFIANSLKEIKENIDIPELAQVIKTPTTEEIVASVLKVCEIDKNELMTSRRGLSSISPARSMAMMALHDKGGMTLKEVADYFGLKHYASAGSTIRSMRGRLESSDELKELYNLIMLDLTP